MVRNFGRMCTFVYLDGIKLRKNSPRGFWSWGTRLWHSQLLIPIIQATPGIPPDFRFSQLRGFARFLTSVCLLRSSAPSICPSGFMTRTKVVARTATQMNIHFLWGLTHFLRAGGTMEPSVLYRKAREEGSGRAAPSFAYPPDPIYDQRQYCRGYLGPCTPESALRNFAGMAL